MLKARNLVILALIVIALAVVSQLQKCSHEKETSRAATAVIVEGEFAREGLSRIVLSYGTEEEVVVLSAQPDGWVVTSAWDAPADPQKIDNLLRDLSNLTGEFRSDSAEVLADYGLGDDASLRIRLMDASGQETAAVDIGKTAEGGRGNFVRQPGQSAVYLTQKSVLNQLGIYSELEAPKSTHFVALEVVKEDRQDIDRLVIRDGEQTLELVKEFGMIEPAAGDTTGALPTIDRGTWEWKLAGDPGVILVKTKVDGVLGGAVSIRATDVADPDAEPAVYGLDAPTRSLTLVRADGSELLVEFGGQRETAESQSAGTWLQVDGRRGVWLATDYTTKSIFKELGELVPEATE